MRSLTAIGLLALPAILAAADNPWQLDDKVKIIKPEDLKDAESVKPPKGAIVLFDGKDFAKWVKKDGKGEVKWTLKDGAMEGVKGHGDIITKEKFGGKFTLHVEFRVPYEPTGAGQGRGNSGVYVQGRYEVQILDSYGLKSKNNDCAAIYEVAAPKVNACKAPTVWQSYDIEFTAPRFAGGKKTEPARMSVRHNGVLVHENVEIPVDNTRAGLGGDPATPGPILLQDHGHPVQYRNIWLVKQ
jgi:3-keto-disaccharide hydrolase